MTTRIRLTALVASGLTIVGMTSPVRAAIVDWNFSGDVTYSDSFNVNSTSRFPGPLPVGDPVSITFRVDTSVACSDTCTETNGHYADAISSVVVSAMGNQYVYNPTSSAISLSRSHASSSTPTIYQDYIKVSFRETTDLPPPGVPIECYPGCVDPFIDGSVSLVANGGSPLNLLNSVLLDLFVLPSPVDFDSSTFELAGAAGYHSVSGFTGDITATSVTPVPIPAAVWLMFSGLGAIGTLARRRRAARIQTVR